MLMLAMITIVLQRRVNLNLPQKVLAQNIYKKALDSVMPTSLSWYHSLTLAVHANHNVKPMHLVISEVLLVPVVPEVS